jgi:hypothetical protein
MGQNPGVSIGFAMSAGVDAVEKCRGVALSLEQAADVADVGLERNGPLQAVINSGHRKVAPLLA